MIFSRRIISTQQGFSDRFGITRVSRVNVSEGQAAGSGFEIKGSPRYIIRTYAQLEYRNHDDSTTNNFLYVRSLVVADLLTLQNKKEMIPIDVTVLRGY